MGMGVDASVGPKGEVQVMVRGVMSFWEVQCVACDNGRGGV